MKKLLLICASAILLTACSEKQEYEEAVLAQLQIEQDLKDYNIDPEKMTECVVDLSTMSMPGLFPLDPVRLTSLQNYTKMLGMSTAEDKEAKLEELRTLFGSPKELAKAHGNYTESMLNCLSSIITKSEKAKKVEETQDIEG